MKGVDLSDLKKIPFEDADTASIEQIIRASKQLQNRHPDTAILLTRKALAQSLSIGYHDGAAAALLLWSFQIAAFKRDISLNRQLRDQAFYFIQRSVYHKAKLLVLYYHDQGVYYARLGKFDSVTLYLQAALNAYQKNKVNNPAILGSIYSNLGGVFLHTNKFKQSLYYAQKAIALQNGKNNPDLIACTMNSGRSFHELGYLDSAEVYVKRAVTLCIDNPKHHLTRMQTWGYLTLGDMARKKRNYDEALYYYQKAVTAEEAFPSYRGYMAIYHGLAEIFKAKGKYRQSESYYKKSIASAAAYEVRGDAVAGLYDSLANLYHFAFKNDRLAFQYKQLATRLNDSFATEEQKKQVAALDARYQSAEKDKELSRQKLLIAKKELQLEQKNFWVALSAVTAILTSVILVVSYRNSKHRQRLQHAHISNLEKGKEIVTLQHIIAGEEQERSRLARELHDGIMVLFSAIKMKLRQLPRSHSSLSNDEEFTSLNEELEQAIRELRQTAHNLMPDMLLDGGLTEAVFYFCRNLEQNSPLHINFQQYGVLPRLREDAELSLYRIVQELVQNIIRHSRANRALVQFNYRDEILGVTVEDNGRGFDHRKANHKGIGLKSIETRLKALSGTMDIRSNESGTTIYLEFYLHSLIKTSNTAKTRY